MKTHTIDSAIAASHEALARARIGEATELSSVSLRVTSTLRFMRTWTN